MTRDLVWIPAVPLPLMGWRTDRCVCGRKFRGKGRRERYALHWRRVHEPAVRERWERDPSASGDQIGVTREEAERIYREVRGVEAA